MLCVLGEQHQSPVSSAVYHVPEKGQADATRGVRLIFRAIEKRTSTCQFANIISNVSGAFTCLGFAAPSIKS